ncbi:hypothetical protein JYQ62_19415 [Nostoc sp. UHCC 0702]|nr:hypothetical protein JYQ62_19415 [Nostoc sp. UHCC 0702]
MATLRDTQGNILYSRSNTNGAIAKGEPVKFASGNYDAMPSFIEQPIKAQTKKTKEQSGIAIS